MSNTTKKVRDHASAVKGLLRSMEGSPPGPDLDVSLPLSQEQLSARTQVLEAYGDFWRHIKFSTGLDEPLFKRKEVEDLLELAAECVVRIRSWLDAHSSHIKLRMLDGSAREYLFTADFHPQTDPERFVRELVHATFQDSKGYVEQLSAPLVDGYLDTFLRARGSFVFKAARERLCDGVGELSGVLGRLAKAHQQLGDKGFDNVSEENASHLLYRMRNVIEQLSSAESALSEFVRDVCKAEENVTSLVQDVASVEQDAKESDHSGAFVETDPVTTTEEEEDDGTSEEDQNLIIKIESVAGDVKLLVSKIQHLQGSLTEVQALAHAGQDVRDRIAALKKKCVELGDLLLQALLSLDSISGGEEVRQVRKEQVKHVQRLLDEVDNVSKELQSIQVVVPSVESVAGDEEEEDEEEGDGDEENEDQQIDQDIQQDLTSYWQKMKLDVDFHIDERREMYLLSAHIPGMDSENIKLSLDEDSGVFSVSGVRMPSRVEELELRRMVKSRRPHLGRDEENALVLQAGAGRFGRFYKTYEIPRNSIAEEIQAVYRNGNLTILVPKRQYQQYQQQQPTGYNRRHPAFRSPPRNIYGDRNLFWM